MSKGLHLVEIKTREWNEFCVASGRKSSITPEAGEERFFLLRRK